MATEPENVQTLTALAQRLGVVKSTVTQWRKRGMPQNEDGTWNVAEVDEWRSADDWDGRKQGKLQELAASEEVSASAKATTQYRQAKAIGEMLKVRKLRGELIDRKEVDNMLVARALEFRRSLEALSKRLPPVLVGREEREIQAELQAAFRSLLAAYARDHGVGGKPIEEAV